MDWTELTSSVFIEEIISPVVIEESIVLAVLAPTPETEINNLNKLRSDLLRKPNKV